MLKKHDHTTPQALAENRLRVFQKSGQRISVRLEEIYWDQLQEIARTDSISLNSLIFRIVGDSEETTNKTSALRTYCLHRLRQEMVLTSIKTGNVDLAAIITACPVPVMVLTPERKIAAYNPAFVQEIIPAPVETGAGDKRTSLRLTFSRPFNQIVKQIVDNPRKIVAGQIGFSTGDRHTQRRVRYALADRSQAELSYIVVFLEQNAAEAVRSA